MILIALIILSVPVQHQELPTRQNQIAVMGLMMMQMAVWIVLIVIVFPVLPVRSQLMQTVPILVKLLAVVWLGKMVMEMFRYFLSFIFFVALISCGSEADDNGEDFGNILDSPSSLVLTEDEHVYGWGRSDCLMCHNINNIHLQNRTDVTIDMEEIQDQVAEEGESICMDCHGSNGTTE